MEKAVEFKHVTKAYGDVQAVRDLSFTIERGKLVTLLGPSGCGKTTTLRLIAGLEMATEGSIFIGGKEVTRLSASDRDVSMVFQSYALFPHMTVMQNVSYGLTMSRLSKTEVSEKALEGLELVSLSGLVKDCPVSYPEDNNNGWLWQGRLCWNRKFCSLMNHSRTWTQSCVGEFAKKSGSCSRNWN